jgi:PhoPQ-activated pathogenicity-related protein
MWITMIITAKYSKINCRFKKNKSSQWKFINLLQYSNWFMNEFILIKGMCNHAQHQTLLLFKINK